MIDKRLFVGLFLLLAGCGSTHTQPAGDPSANPKAGLPSLGGGGTDIGSAGDNLPEEHLAAWFVGTRPAIRACVEVAPDFGVDAEVAKDTVVEAFAVWRRYIAEHHIHAEQNASKRLATEIRLDEKCDSETDIAFYLGVENAAVTKAKQQFANPTAFVHRQSFDSERSMGKGFVWVAKTGSIRLIPTFPMWKRDGRLLAALIHELGHVYGNGHVNGTVMTENISELLDGNWEGWELAKIDHCRELAPCRNCDYFTAPNLALLPKAVVDFFYRASGVEADRFHDARLVRDGTGRFMTLSLVDNRGISQLFLLDQKSSKAVFSTDAPVFKVLQDSQVVSLVNQSSVQYASLMNYIPSLILKGVVSIEYNLATCGAERRDGRSAVQISVLDSDRQLPFAAFPASMPRTSAD